MSNPSGGTDLNFEPATDEVARYAAGLKAATQEIYALQEQKAAIATELVASREFLHRLDNQHREDLRMVFKHLQTNFSDLDQVPHPRLVNLFRALAVQHHRTSTEFHACRNELTKSKNVLEELMGVARSHAELEKAHLAQSSVLQRVQSDLAQAQTAGKDQNQRIKDLELKLTYSVPRGDTQTQDIGQRWGLPRLEAADNAGLNDYEDNLPPRQLVALGRNEEPHRAHDSNIIWQHSNNRSSIHYETSRPHLDHGGHVRQHHFQNRGTTEDHHHDGLGRQQASSRPHQEEKRHANDLIYNGEYLQPDSRFYEYSKHHYEGDRGDSSRRWSEHDEDIYHEDDQRRHQEQSNHRSLTRQQQQNKQDSPRYSREVRGQNDRRRLSKRGDILSSSLHPTETRSNELMKANTCSNNNWRSGDRLRPRSVHDSQAGGGYDDAPIMQGSPAELRLPPLSAPSERTSGPTAGR